ncbi:Isochorismatase hydrolase [Trematosphaeria pertusa]|uniref:Isochorismatase hydrolase n=1 Tax=Trematosphaeria pertusa TaxID=390896 RepID=A0A6A6ICP6_9PLEO|nr:Isochorismatase hydrolase [Trematosphaeria pertusa]KAF2248345.1 Isochorismatase hydrolase [Trematosphaeria pertusa]
MSSTLASQHRKALIGSPSNFWLHHTSHGFDLTHPSSPTASTLEPKVTIQTTTSPITISPSKSALVIIDMQNFFLSESFGRNRGPGHAACEQLIKHAIPAARKAGMRTIWLNWGLTEKDVKEMPPAVKRAFGFFSIPAEEEFAEDFSAGENSVSVDKFGDNGAMYRGLGAECGTVELDDGKKVDAGRLLMRDTWNAALYPPLASIYEEGTKLPHNPDVWIHKNRMSGMWGSKTDCEEFLEKEGIKTLFFTGVNTDQCVGGSFTDSFSKGYDCILLSDGCGTTSPEFAQQCFEFNAAKTFGFCTTCGEFAKGVESMKK